MTDLSFVDTNVLVYARDPRDPAKQARAAEWIARLWRDRCGRISVQVLSEYYVSLKRLGGAGSAESWERVQRFFAWQPLPTDELLLRRGWDVEQRWRLNWWDAMIVAAAQLQDCTLLLSEDLHDGAVFGGVTVRSPFTLEVREPVVVHAPGPLATPRHRPRGRPKRMAMR